MSSNANVRVDAWPAACPFKGRFKAPFKGPFKGRNMTASVDQLNPLIVLRNYNSSIRRGDCGAALARRRSERYRGFVKGPYQQGPYRHDPPRFIFNPPQTCHDPPQTCTDMIRLIFDRIDLRINLSEAKFDGEADFDVRSAVDPRKARRNSDKRKF